MAIDMLRVRIELEDVEPPVWRTVEVPTGLTLDVLHQVVQAVMGWTDSHLHRFFVDDRWARASRTFVTAQDLVEGERGVPESDVAIGELLREVGDELLYTYDFGDGWDHVLRLEGMTSSADGAARCLGGQRACPPEDCGGAPGYEELFRGWSPSRRAVADRFDVGAAQRMLDVVLTGAHASLTAGDGDAPGRSDLRPDAGGSLPEPVEDLLSRAAGGARTALVQQVQQARLDRPALVDVATAARMVAPVTWMVGHVGVGGVPLTSAGYLRPVDVQAVVHALRIDREWIGTLNREVQTYPVLLFREALQKTGLLRVNKGRLHATRAAAGLAADPVGMWRHLAERLPVGKAAERDAGLLVLLDLAGRDGVSAPAADESPADPGTALVMPPSEGRVAAAMAALGWQYSDGSVLDARDVAKLAEHTVALLRRCGVFVEAPKGTGSLVRRTTVPTPEGSALARAALQIWR